MTAISPVDRLVAVLRQRLQERDGFRVDRRATPSRSPGAANPVQAARALAAIEAVDERQLRRALIQGVLADHFGAEVLNEAGFQQMVDRVLSAVENDEGGRALLDRLARDLRA